VFPPPAISLALETCPTAPIVNPFKPLQGSVPAAVFSCPSRLNLQRFAGDREASLAEGVAEGVAGQGATDP